MLGNLRWSPCEELHIPSYLFCDFVPFGPPDYHIGMNVCVSSFGSSCGLSQKQLRHQLPWYKHQQHINWQIVRWTTCSFKGIILCPYVHVMLRQGKHRLHRKHSYPSSFLILQQFIDSTLGFYNKLPVGLLLFMEESNWCLVIKLQNGSTCRE